MTGYLKICTAVYWIGLTVWFSALVTATIAAAHVFATLGAMPMQLERYAAYPAEEHGRLAGGHVMDGVFFTVDLLQFAAIPLTVLALLAQLTIFKLPVRSPANLVRTICVLGAAGLFAAHATMLAPKMNHELRARWAAAEAGDVAASRAHQGVFSEQHRVAESILGATGLLLVVAVGASAAAFVPAAAGPSPSLPEPRLLRS